MRRLWTYVGKNMQTCHSRSLKVLPVNVRSIGPLTILRSFISNCYEYYILISVSNFKFDLKSNVQKTFTKHVSLLYVAKYKDSYIVPVGGTYI
jgi:hypothetical protein